MLDSGGSGARGATFALAAPATHGVLRPRAATAATLGIALLALCASLPAAAEWRPSALLRFASSYVYHGYDKSDGHPVTQVHGGLSHDSGLFGGLWLTQLDFGGAQLEAIPYAGLQYHLTPDLRADAVLSGYLYDAKVFGADADYSEVSVSLDWRREITARMTASFDTYGGGNSTYAAEINGRYPLTDVLDAVVTSGYDAVTRVTDYDVIWWSAGLSYFIGKYVVAELRYVDQRYVNEVRRAHGEAGLSGAEMGRRALFTLSVGF